jgi:hypothetical protein
VRRPKFLKSVLLAGFFFAAVAGATQAAAGPSDGFTPARMIESRFFSIQLAPGVDEPGLVVSLGLGPESKVLAGQTLSSPNDLANLMDAFFIWACGVLDMQLYSYRGTIKVVRDQNELAGIYLRLYGVERRSDKGFYIYELNTLYVTAQDFSKEILGHEIGHAIISNFFVVQAPEKVQEVLAGYIEYQLRKKPRPNEVLEQGTSL